MALPVIYLVIILAYLGLLFAFFLKDHIFIILVSFVLFALSIFTFVNGIDAWSNSNFLVIMFSSVTFAIAAYASSRSTIEMIESNY